VSSFSLLNTLNILKEEDLCACAPGSCANAASSLMVFGKINSLVLFIFIYQPYLLPGKNAQQATPQLPSIGTHLDHVLFANVHQSCYFDGVLPEQTNTILAYCSLLLTHQMSIKVVVSLGYFPNRPIPPLPTVRCL
jgi:hypothetical protein